MHISDINPFIRFAQEVVLTESKSCASTYDNRLFYLTDGECGVIVDGVEYKIQTGTVMLWKSGTVYRFLIENQIKLIAIDFDYTQSFKEHTDFLPPVETDVFDEGRILEKIDFTDSKRLNMPIVINRMYDVYPYLEKIVRDCRKNLLFSEKYCSSVLSEVIIKVVRSVVFPSAAVYNRMDKVIEYIEENYAQDISNRELADIAGYHPYHLNRLMRDYTQSTVHQYLMGYRLKKSQELLTNTSFGITEISELCGFRSAYYFSNVFKRRFNVSPTEYRRNQKNKA